jgi:hypothetical protein
MPTYPSEQYPGETTIIGLNGSADPTTGLDYISRGANANSNPSYEVQYNRRLHRQNRILAAVRQGMVVDEGGLQIGVYPINYTLGAMRRSFAGATGQPVPDDTTKRVYLDSNNNLQIQDSFPNDLGTYLPLATVMTDHGTTTVSDERSSTLFTVPEPAGLIDAQGGTGQAAATVVPYSPVFFLAGSLSVRAWEIEFVAPVGFVIRNVIGRVAAVPTGAAAMCDVRLDGVSIFESREQMVNIAAGTREGTSAAIERAVSPGQVISFEIEQVGSGAPGADMTVLLNGRTALQT